MRRPHCPLTLALVTTACLLCACESRGGPEPAHETHPLDRRPESTEHVDLTWGPLERVAGKSATANGDAAVVAPDGTATVIWVGDRGVVSRQAAPGKRWNPTEQIHGTTEAVGADVMADVDKHGTVTAVWMHSHYDRSGEERYSFWSSQHPAGGRWSRPVRLGGGLAGDVGATDWDLAVSPSGAAVFAWSPEEFGAPIRAVYRSRNGSWSLPAPVSSPGPSDLVVTIDPGGLATVAYVRDDGGAGGAGLLTMVQGSARGWSKPMNLDTPVEAQTYDIDAAGRGDVVAVWQDTYLRFVTAHLRAGVMTDEHPLTETAQRIADPQVAASTDGSAQFVWSAGRGPREIQGVHQSASGALGDPEVMGPIGSSRETYPPVLDRNDQGDSILLWSGPDERAPQLAYKSGTAKTWSSHTDVVPGGSGPNDWASPTVTIAEDGSALLTWENYHGNSERPEATELLARRAPPPT